ncbi:MAG: hypothetical protein J7484_07745 [Microbacterium sp.]|nr:hypothetical protein [Microbacterium sp.]
MSTSDQQGPLTRKQLRELRMTGSTPVITAEESAEAAKQVPPAPPLPRAAEPVIVPPAPHADADVDLGEAPLTRRQAREQERIKTASVPVIGQDGPVDADAEPAAEAPVAETVVEEAPEAEIVSEVPRFDTPAVADEIDDDDVDEEVAVAPVSAAAAVDTVGEVPLTAAPVDDETPADADEAQADADDQGVAALGFDVPAHDDEDESSADDDVLADVKDSDDDIAADERPTVSPAFGSGLLADDAESQRAFAPSFDELLTAGDSAGTHVASNTLIFNPPAGEGSLSGPVASTGEILVTGSYELPQGIGSQGHAHGTADGKDVDAVLIDGELPPASSPTPIAASAAISTIKPAGEVIRPPAPEKGNKLMIILAIVAGGLALAVGVAVVIAITQKVF